MRSISRYFLTFAFLVFFAVPAFGSINGGFETGDFTGFGTIGVNSIETAAFGSGPVSGTFQALSTTGAGSASAADIETFLGLSAGSLTTLASSIPGTFGLVTEGSAISKTVSGSSGDILSFDFNFLSNDGTPGGQTVADFSFFSLVNLTTGELELLADSIGSTFGPSATVFAGETGFSSFSFALPSTDSFLLGIGVVDGSDTIIDSALLVDNIVVSSGGAIPEPTMFIVWAGLACCGTLATKRRR